MLQMFNENCRLLISKRTAVYRPGENYERNLSKSKTKLKGREYLEGIMGYSRKFCILNY